ncbi:hypothetical protein [Legionella taurinensis]|uniref:hypothetical protein n=1 Tax=Legionella taurinensis TaxID=70611 RepID=UPI001FD29649|nr:hypothetical protein [Legionella taurinensis]MDX1837263.1 hypothetical protein [Legionella taurinensis]
MLSTSDAKHLVGSDSASSFRNLLGSLIKNPDVSSILIGEIHDFSPTLDAVLSNLDILADSPRRVIIIAEELNQVENSALQSALKKAKKGDVDPLKKMSLFKEKTIHTYELIFALFSVGILIQGAENKKTNPFIGSEEVDIDVLRKMEAYQRSTERITVTNSEFARLITHFCSEETLPIFIGGAAHVVALSSKDGLFDPGLQGRVKNSVSVYLIDSVSTVSITESFPYKAADRELTGQYDYMVMTNKKTLYKETFSSIDNLNEKVDYLITVLDKLLHCYLLFPRNATVSLPYDLEPILEAFQDDNACQCAFKALRTIFKEVTQEKEKLLEKDKFSFFTRSKPISYSKNQLALALHEDLAELLSVSSHEKADKF